MNKSDSSCNSETQLDFNMDDDNTSNDDDINNYQQETINDAKFYSYMEITIKEISKMTNHDTELWEKQ